MFKVKHIPQYTYEDYKLWKGEWELIDGLPYSMTPSAKGNHQFISMKISNIFFNQIDKRNCKEQCFVYSELDWVIDDNTVVRPDIAIVCGEKVEEYIRKSPVLIVEIISKSSAYHDRIIKKELYESQSVKLYLLADPETKTIEVFELNGKEYQQVQVNQDQHAFLLSNDCKIIVELTDVWE